MGDINQFMIVRRNSALIRDPILEVGSRDYGSTPDFRSLFSQPTDVGLDRSEGRGLDVVLETTDDFHAVDARLASAGLACAPRGPLPAWGGSPPLSGCWPEGACTLCSPGPHQDDTRIDAVPPGRLALSSWFARWYIVISAWTGAALLTACLRWPRGVLPICCVGLARNRYPRWDGGLPPDAFLDVNAE